MTSFTLQGQAYAKAGLHLTFFKYFLIVSELKGGYINMYDVRTTYDIADKAKHDFFFFETVLGIGGTFRFQLIKEIRA